MNYKIKMVFIIFISALLFRIFLINTNHTDTMLRDENGYYRLAFNIASLNEYTLKNGEKYFFREPGFPIFLSLSVHIAEFFGCKTGQLTLGKNRLITENTSEVLLAKYIQAILDSVTTVLLFTIFSHVIRLKFAFFITLFYCFYFPNANYTAYLMRETLQTFYAICMCLTLVKYFYKNEYKYLVLTGIFLGLLSLTFFTTSIFVLSIPIFICIYKKSLKKSIMPSIIVIVFFLLTISPWLYRTYNVVQDIRILKSFGTSFTFELLEYQNAIIKAEYYGAITEKEADDLRKEWYGLPDSEKFRLSYDGSISIKSDSLNSLISESFISKRIIKKIMTNIYRTWFPWPSLFAREILDDFKTNTVSLLKNNTFLTVSSIAPIFMIGLFAIVGILKYFRKFSAINIILITFLIISFVIGNESRRTLPAVPFIFMYGIVGIMYIYNKLFKKLTDYQIDLKLLN